MNVHFVLWSHATLLESFPNSPVGGAERAIFEIAKRMTDSYQVHIHCWGITSREVDGVKILRYAPERILQSKYITPDIFYYKIMKNIKKMGKNQIVHSLNCIEPFFHSDSSFRNFLHLENDLSLYLPFPPFKKKIYLSRLRRINNVIAVSKYIKEVFQSNFDYPENQIVVMNNGADTDIFNPEKRNRQFFRDKLGILKDDFVFLFSGRIILSKGLHLAIKAFLDIAKTNDHVWLLVAGAAPKHFGLGAKTKQSTGKTDQIASRLIVPHSRIIYLGPINMNMMPLYYASSDALIVPSIWEDPCPLTCAESQASGVPVIGTDRGGIPDSVIHEQTGLICQPNVKDIIRSMTRLTDNKNLVKSLSKNARIRAVEHLDWDHITNSIRSLYETRSM